MRLGLGRQVGGTTFTPLIQKPGSNHDDEDHGKSDENPLGPIKLPFNSRPYDEEKRDNEVEDTVAYHSRITISCRLSD